MDFKVVFHRNTWAQFFRHNLYQTGASFCIREVYKIDEHLQQGGRSNYEKKIEKQKLLKDATRLVMLYALRFENHANNDIHGLVQLLKRKGVNTHYVKVCITCRTCDRKKLFL